MIHLTEAKVSSMKTYVPITKNTGLQCYDSTFTEGRMGFAKRHRYDGSDQCINQRVDEYCCISNNERFAALRCLDEGLYSMLVDGAMVKRLK
ncbi:hypothetical protein M513_00885 [Trichuris suis]|uniref:Uncharacterized protein n=1 Tax=Trichuris suis TaxID=68888 RepID=A0A085MLM6_9BILA|nr:hypothetical protein M513_00885 [Trichuris suis]